MGFEVRPEPLGDGRVVVRISGELDLSTRDVVASAVRSVLHTDRTADIVVDLSGTRFLDAGGIGALVLARSLARAAGARLAVRGASGLVAAVLRVTHADQVLSAPAEARPVTWPGVRPGPDAEGDTRRPPGSGLNP